MLASNDRLGNQQFITRFAGSKKQESGGGRRALIGPTEMAPI